jgi:cytochrome c
VKSAVTAALLGAALACACARATEPAAASPETLSAGERAFQKCYACHSVDPAEKGADGPTLRGIVGRKVASVPGYGYSEAMKTYGSDGKTWTRERVDAYIANPQAVVPHNAMSFFGIADAKERAALVAWLAEQR